MDQEGNKASDRTSRKLSPREVFKLVLSTYAASLPYVVLFVVIMLIATWFLTTVVFH